MFNSSSDLFGTARFNDLVSAVTDGRTLSVPDSLIVNTYAGLVLQVEDALSQIDREGQLVDGPNGCVIENPAVGVLKKCSQELRGWGNQRPDLFGEKKAATRAPRTGFPGMKVVNGNGR